MGTLLNRRRYMGSRGSSPSPYDDFGYIKDGKTFHLDGISIGDNTNAWTDLIGGIIFPVVSGVTHDTNHFNFASTHGYMESNPRTTLDFPTTGTIEVVADCGSNMAIIFTGKVETIACIIYNNELTPGMGISIPVFNMSSYFGNTVQISCSADAIYIDGNSVSATRNNFMSVNVGYCVIGNGNNGTNRPFIGNIYSIRYYNRVLTAEERANNIAVDRLRFNLTLS